MRTDRGGRAIFFENVQPSDYLGRGATRRIRVLLKTPDFSAENGLFRQAVEKTWAIFGKALAITVVFITMEETWILHTYHSLEKLLNWKRYWRTELKSMRSRALEPDKLVGADFICQ